MRSPRERNLHRTAGCSDRSCLLGCDRGGCKQVRRNLSLLQKGSVEVLRVRQVDDIRTCLENVEPLYEGESSAKLLVVTWYTVEVVAAVNVVEGAKVDERLATRSARGVPKRTRP